MAQTYSQGTEGMMPKTHPMEKIKAVGPFYNSREFLKALRESPSNKQLGILQVGYKGFRISRPSLHGNRRLETELKTIDNSDKSCPRQVWETQPTSSTRVLTSATEFRTRPVYIFPLSETGVSFEILEGDKHNYHIWLHPNHDTKNPLLWLDGELYDSEEWWLPESKFPLSTVNPLRKFKAIGAAMTDPTTVTTVAVPELVQSWDTSETPETSDSEEDEWSEVDNEGEKKHFDKDLRNMDTDMDASFYNYGQPFEPLNEQNNAIQQLIHEAYESDSTTEEEEDEEEEDSDSDYEVDEEDDEVDEEDDEVDEVDEEDDENTRVKKRPRLVIRRQPEYRYDNTDDEWYKQEEFYEYYGSHDMWHAMHPQNQIKRQVLSYCAITHANMPKETFEVYLRFIMETY